MELLGTPQKKALRVLEVMAKGESATTCRHALFIGPSGSGKTTLAELYAKMVSSDSDAELETRNCATDKKADIDALVETFPRPPLFTTHTIIFLDEVHALSAAAQNSLLVPIDSVYDHLVITAATTEPRKVIAPLRSRMVVFELTAPSADEIRTWLKKQVPADVADEILARNPERNMREVKSALDIYKLTGTLVGAGSHDEKSPALFGQIKKAYLKSRRIEDVLALITKDMACEQEAAALAFYSLAVLRSANGRRDFDTALAMAYTQLYGENGLSTNAPPQIALASLLMRAITVASKVIK